MTDHKISDDERLGQSCEALAGFLELARSSTAGSGPGGRKWNREKLHDRREAKPDIWSAIEQFRAEADLEALDADEVWEDVRDRSPGRDADS